MTVKLKKLLSRVAVVAASALASSALLSSALRERAALVAMARHSRHHVKLWTRRQQAGWGCSGC